MKTDRLEEIRRDLGLSKAQMADLMGIEASYYSHILKGEGKGNLRLEHLERLLNDANVNPLWLITGEGEKYLGKTQDLEMRGEPTEEEVEQLYNFVLQQHPAELSTNQIYMLKLACAQAFVDYPELKRLDQLGLVVSVYLRVIVRFPTIDLVNLLGLNDVAAALSK
jgi:transcriptional regulator with XRE-family HTH domain